MTVTIANSSITFLESDPSVWSRPAVARCYLIFVVIDGDMRLRVDGIELRLTGGHGAIVAPERTYSFSVEERQAALLWRVSKTALERQAVLLTGNEMLRAVRFDPHVRLDIGRGPSLFRAIRFVATEFHDDCGISQSRAIQEHMEQMLIRALLETQPSQISEALDCRRARAVPRCVLRAERYIAEHLGNEITVEGIVAAAGVSGRTLFNAFKKSRGTSPMAHVRQLRLEQVRRDLLSAEPRVRVTDILSRRGITQSGRFAASYKKVYGESPSKTIRI